MTYQEEIQRLFDLQKFGMKFGLENMRTLLTRLGEPQKGLKLVHLAGTNGKGSVGIMLKSGLDEAGYRTGFYTSPHLVTFRERIVVGPDLISETDVLRLLSRVWPQVDQKSPPTFFEFVTALAFMYFQEQKVEVAVIEAGLGGRMDSTNVIEPLVTAITNVSLDHTEHLGDTVSAIAAEKAGVIKPGRPLVTGQLNPEAEAVIAQTATEKNSPWLALGRDFEAKVTGRDEAGRSLVSFTQAGETWADLPLSLAGAHQIDNAAVALALSRLLTEQGFGLRAEHFRAGLARAAWPGRTETWPPGAWPPAGPRARAPLLVDGAHNPAGALALADHLAGLPRRRLHLLVGVMADKDITNVLGPLLPLADRLYLTRPRFTRAASPELLRDKITAALGPPPIPTSLHPELEGAFQTAASEAEPEDLVVLSGSLFTVGESLAFLRGLGPVESN
ncbi:MAG: bifunctional folylpolyglutamate synthase/dihydrofolate synthase [Candidatus Adiutrix sp.]|jgi:dihydrofolate synthase/folylpolyglutamate synthase|nr:bifunctional folylpolyglutamate synthase/dihydrofolate synthase [Candidatus Adiutrix sp.]